MPNKKLHVKRTTVNEVRIMWGHHDLNDLQMHKLLGVTLMDTVYVRCNRKGNVNWNVAPVYSSKELIERNNVKILS